MYFTGAGKLGNQSTPTHRGDSVSNEVASTPPPVLECRGPRQPSPRYPSPPQLDYCGPCERSNTTTPVKSTGDAGYDSSMHHSDIAIPNYWQTTRSCGNGQGPNGRGCPIPNQSNTTTKSPDTTSNNNRVYTKAEMDDDTTINNANGATTSNIAGYNTTATTGNRTTQSQFVYTTDCGSDTSTSSRHSASSSSPDIHVDSPNLDSPDIDSPNLDSPDIDSPNLDSPNIDLPDIDSPNIDLPDINSPDMHSPDIDLPDIDSTDIDLLDIISPDIHSPDINSPDIDSPDLDLLGIDLPDINTPDRDSSDGFSSDLPDFGISVSRVNSPRSLSVGDNSSAETGELDRDVRISNSTTRDGINTQVSDFTDTRGVMEPELSRGCSPHGPLSYYTSNLSPIVTDDVITEPYDVIDLTNDDSLAEYDPFIDKPQRRSRDIDLDMYVKSPSKLGYEPCNNGNSHNSHGNRLNDSGNSHSYHGNRHSDHGNNGGSPNFHGNSRHDEGAVETSNMTEERFRHSLALLRDQLSTDLRSEFITDDMMTSEYMNEDMMTSEYMNEDMMTSEFADIHDLQHC